MDINDVFWIFCVNNSKLFNIKEGTLKALFNLIRLFISHVFIWSLIGALLLLCPRFIFIVSKERSIVVGSRGGGNQCQSSAELWHVCLPTRFLPPIIGVFHPRSSSGQTGRISTFAIPCTRNRRIGDSGCVHPIMETPPDQTPVDVAHQL